MEDIILIDIIGYEGLYVARNDGKIINKKTGRILKPSITRGYERLVLYKNKKPKNFLVHRLIAESFMGKLKDKEVINHIDGNKLNNNYTNLEICSYLENSCHASKFKTKSSKYIGVCFDKGENKWVAQINIGGINKKLGRFKNEIDAYLCRLNYEKDNNIKNKYLC